MSRERASELRLVGDVGGTNVRFALIDRSLSEPTLIAPKGFLCADFPSLEAAIDHYLAQQPDGVRPTSAVIAVAGPVTDGEAALTNGRWRMSESALASHGFEVAKLINDYAALSLSVSLLSGDDLGAIGDAKPDPRGSVAIIGPGTGLGIGGLIRDGLGQAVAVTEGGHIAFAPTDEVEIDILRHLTATFGRVSLERILSGPGLVNLHGALAAIRSVSAPDLEPEQIVERATKGTDALCVETLDRFCAIYGSAAGDLALVMGATGGVYLGGGIPPRILAYLRKSAFRTRFEEKGRFRAYTAPIATQVILHPHAALLGAGDAPLASQG